MTHRVQTVDLAFRRSDSTTWVAIDPTSTTGRRFRDRLETTFPMEEAMTPAMAYVEQEPKVPLTLVEGASASQTGFWLRLRAMGRRAWNWLSSLPKRAWNTVTENPVAQKTGGWLSRAWSWVKAKVTAVGSALGVPGMTGAGLLTLTTHTGQRMIGWAFTPVRWFFQGIDVIWTWTASQVGRAGRPGEWVANRMMDVEEFFAGNTTGKVGLIGRVSDWLSAYVKPFIDPDATHMGFLRALGYALFGWKVPAVLALFPLGFALTPLTWLATIGFGLVALGTALDTMEDFDWWTRFLDRNGITRMRTRTAKEPESPLAPAVAVVETEAEVVEEAVAAAGAAVPKMDAAMNRAERRGAAPAQASKARTRR